MNFGKHSVATLIFVAILFARPAAENTFAQDPEEPQLDRNELLEGQIVSLTLYPAKESIPALKHRFVLERSEMIDRNAAIYYHRAIHLDRAVRDSTDVDVDVFNDWLSATPSELPLKKVESWLSENRAVFNELQKASRCLQTDWGLLPTQFDTEPWYVLEINEIQHTRRFAWLLSIKAKYEIATGDFEEAIRILRMGYRIGIDAGKAGFLVGDLVGIADIGITNRALRELIQQPNAPSLFWALAELPRPMVDSRQSVRQELLLMREGSGTKILNKPEEKRWSPEEWRAQFFNDVDNIQNILGLRPSGIGIHGMAAATMLRGYPIAKQSLIDSGMDAAEVDAMPVVQVVAVYEGNVIDNKLDEYNKALTLPFRQSIEVCEQLEDSESGFFLVGSKKGTSVLPTVDFFFPATNQVMSADLRIRNRMVSLQTIEAIRLHLGATGKLPDSLSDIKVVPVPNNVWTGKPIFYKRTAEGASLIEFSRYERNAKIYDLKVGEVK